MPSFDPNNIPVFENVRDRVDYIESIMRCLDWERGKTGPILAKRWGLGDSAVEKYATEASRRLTADRDTAARDITYVATEMLKKAFLAGKARDAAMMMDRLAAVSGANAPTKQELRVDADADARELMANVFRVNTGKGEGESGSEPEADSEPLAESEPD